MGAQNSKKAKILKSNEGQISTLEYANKERECRIRLLKEQNEFLLRSIQGKLSPKWLRVLM